VRDIEGIENALEVLKPYWAEIEVDFARHNERFLALAAADHDASGRVLRVHLIVENFLDTYLSETFGIENIEEIRLTFAQKSKLLPSKNSSAAFVRPGIIQLNAVRNKFGHRINHEIQHNEISAILQALEVARPGNSFASLVEAIEAFAPVACAFLSVPPRHLQNLFMEAFSHVQSHTPAAAT
jgi:hypothetical protein